MRASLLAGAEVNLTGKFGFLKTREKWSGEPWLDERKRVITTPVFSFLLMSRCPVSAIVALLLASMVLSGASKCPQLVGVV